MSVKLVIIADTHIPERATWIPSKIEEVLLNEVRDARILVHGGDLVSEEVLEWAKGLAPEFYVVRGNMDYLDLPERVVIDLGFIKIGVIHGYQVHPRGNIRQLTEIAKSMGVKVLISAHTHTPLIKKYEGILHLNPGSLTGVWGGGGGSMRPSFITVQVDKSNAKVTLYELENDVIRKREENISL